MSTTKKNTRKAATASPELTAALDTLMGPKEERITEAQLFGTAPGAVFLEETTQVEVGGKPSEAAQEAPQDVPVVTLDIETLEPSDARAACQVSTSAALAALRMTLHHRRTETCE